MKRKPNKMKIVGITFSIDYSTKIGNYLITYKYLGKKLAAIL
jgi:hypothetical protein